MWRKGAWGSLGDLPGMPSVSIRNGAASTRKPEKPSSIQNPMIFCSSARTRGFSMFRSGWNL